MTATDILGFDAGKWTHQLCFTPKLMQTFSWLQSSGFPLHITIYHFGTIPF